MVSFETSDLRSLLPSFLSLLVKSSFVEIGQGLATFGVIFTLIGVALFFDKGFLAVGNILILSGVILTAGSGLLQFFLKPKNYKGSLPLVCGFLFVITGWPVTGLFFETCGFVFLFREFWPTIANFSRKLPILGSLLRQFCAPPYFAPSRGMRCPV